MRRGAWSQSGHHCLRLFKETSLRRLKAPLRRLKAPLRWLKASLRRLQMTSWLIAIKVDYECRVLCFLWCCCDAALVCALHCGVLFKMTPIWVLAKWQIWLWCGFKRLLQLEFCVAVTHQRERCMIYQYIICINISLSLTREGDIWFTSLSYEYQYISTEHSPEKEDADLGDEQEMLYLVSAPWSSFTLVILINPDHHSYQQSWSATTSWSMISNIPTIVQINNRDQQQHHDSW